MANRSEPVERPWGYYQSLDGGIHDGYQIKKIVVKPGDKLSLQYHHKRSEHWTCIKGHAKVQIGEDFFELHRNQSVVIPTGVKHRIMNPTEDEMLEIIEVQIGDYLGEDDIVRLEDAYGRA